MSADAVVVALAERNQADWLAACARATGGADTTDGPLRWVGLPHTGESLLLFPEALPEAPLDRWITAARKAEARTLGCWLAAGAETAPLAERGFERGWDPRWMTADLDALADPDDPRVALDAGTPEYDEHGRALLALARDPARSWHAAARLNGRWAGRAWAHRTDEVAGIYDVDVPPWARRRGLARALTLTVASAARKAGARLATLNATHGGSLLYPGLGFASVGDGRTWWRHEATP